MINADCYKYTYIYVCIQMNMYIKNIFKWQGPKVSIGNRSRTITLNEFLKIELFVIIH